MCPKHCRSSKKSLVNKESVGLKRQRKQKKGKEEEGLIL